MRFVSVGCSITYGEGLPDCISDNLKWAGPTPSNLSWASLLSKRYNAPLINLSIPGASNFYIFNKVVDFDWQPGDIALLLFTFYHRYTIFDDGILPHNITPHDVNVKSKMHRAKVFYDLFDDHHLALNDRLSIDSSFYCLSHHNVPFASRFINLPQQQQYLKHTKVKDKQWISHISKTPFFEFQVDQGLDLGGHPGPKTHELFANSLIQDIDDIVNMRE
jgi:hypothetical protein